MASINGITLKGVKTFIGMEGPAEQGNIYLDNKKVGFFSQDGDGGPSRIDVDNKNIYEELEKRSKQYFDKFPPKLGKNPSEDLVRACTTVESMFDELIVLCDFEKDYKKAIKKGYEGIAYVKRPLSHEGPFEMPMEYMYRTKEIAQKDLKDKIEDDDWEVTFYFSPDDFIFNC